MEGVGLGNRLLNGQTALAGPTMIGLASVGRGIQGAVSIFVGPGDHLSAMSNICPQSKQHPVQSVRQSRAWGVHTFLSVIAPEDVVGAKVQCGDRVFYVPESGRSVRVTLTKALFLHGVVDSA